MARTFQVAGVGAAGVVDQGMLRLLELRDSPVGELVQVAEGLLIG